MTSLGVIIGVVLGVPFGLLLLGGLLVANDEDSPAPDLARGVKLKSTRTNEQPEGRSSRSESHSDQAGARDGSFGRVGRGGSKCTNRDSEPSRWRCS